MMMPKAGIAVKALNTKCTNDPTEKALAETVISEHVPNGNPGVLVLFQDRVEAIKTCGLSLKLVVPEILSWKIPLFGELDAILPEDCILASNSSSYTGSEMFERVKNKAGLVNTHYYMPPGMLPLQIMPNPYTDPAIVVLLLREAPHHGLRAYHVRKESVGLLFNRIAGTAEVDGIMKDVLGMNCGVFEMLDSIGLDVALDIETH
ncbi:hypothetical protein B0H14DRAFT_3491128 [Mycena olivaceomarginata]|nr:hypothetical protein B0H14DRAFT_3491128 [Mycena olivaceomarginata]